MPRSRYRWDEELKQLVEVGEDWTGAERRAPTVTEELVYGGARATDGTDISSRNKHADYLKRNNLAMASDFTNHWQTKSVERQRAFTGEADTKERREQVGRALYESRRKRR